MQPLCRKRACKRTSFLICFRIVSKSCAHQLSVLFTFHLYLVVVELNPSVADLHNSNIVSVSIPLPNVDNDAIQSIQIGFHIILVIVLSYLSSTVHILSCKGKAICPFILANPLIFQSYLNLFKWMFKYLGRVLRRVVFYASWRDAHLSQKNLSCPFNSSLTLKLRIQQDRLMLG